MARIHPYQQDIDRLLASRHIHGGDLWASADGKLYTGNPYSTVNVSLMLLELGMSPDDPILQQTAAMILGAWREDGQYRLNPSGTLFPCYTAIATRLLCRLGYVKDPRVQRSLDHFLETQQPDGGWRCNKSLFGHGPETAFSNPGPTLEALDAFRFSGRLNQQRQLDQAVEFLLGHWLSRRPLGPCHWGIGTLFMQVEYPFYRYNLFFYVYVLSFYSKARKDKRLLEAFDLLSAKMRGGQLVVERPHVKLKGLQFCAKGEPSEAATRRYREIMQNLNNRT